MAEKRYRVAGPLRVLDHKPGETFDGPLPPDVIEIVLLEAGVLEDVTPAPQKPKPVKCPVCVAQKVSRPAKIADLDELRQHFADKHPALVAPDELPDSAEKEE